MKPAMENKLNISFEIASLLDKGEYQCDHLQKLRITVTENHLLLITLRTPFVITTVVCAFDIHYFM